MTTQELMARVGIKSRQTLYAWRNAGLLGEQHEDKPITSSRESLQWDEATAQRCLRIKQLQREGMTLAAIANQLAIETKQRRTRKAAAHKESGTWIYAADHTMVAIGEEITKAVKHVARFVRNVPTKDLITIQHLQEAIALDRENKSPVCIVHSAKVIIMPLKQLNSFLDSFDDPAAVIVICCRKLIRVNLSQTIHTRDNKKTKPKLNSTKKQSRSVGVETARETRGIRFERSVDLP